jgi:LytS/YehU family sensor histidine kinase
VAFLSRQDRPDYTVRQPVEEKPIARSSELKNELDPHFFFNCMNTLSYLVRNDAEKAWQFVHKLSNVYKYFLRNKEKSLVPLHEEMEFLDNYLFLLQVRFDDNILVTKNLNAQNGVSILPCTLQVLVENAIKHNFFSEKEPLVISIEQNGYFLHVSNPMRPKVHASESVESGLRNLQTRYRVLAQQQVILQKANSRFLVKLPIVKTISHDKSSDH